VTDTRAQQDARRRSLSNEENRYMQKSAMIAPAGETTAVYLSGVHHAQI
jgi:hypothetical protein